MYLTKLHLQNFRMFDNFELSLDPHFTLLRHPHASDLLDAAAIAIGTFLRVFPEVRRPTLLKRTAWENIFPLEVAAEGYLGETPLEWRLTIPRQNSRISPSGMKDFLRVAQTYADAVVNGDLSVTIPLLLYWLEGMEEKEMPEGIMRGHRQYGYIDCLFPNHDTTLARQWLRKMTIGEFQHKCIAPEANAARHTIASCCGKLAGVEGMIAEYNLGNDRVEIRETPQSAPATFPASQQEVIDLVISIVCRMAMLNPQRLGEVARTEGIVLMDEARGWACNGAWQEQFSVLQELFPNVQFIVACQM